MGTTPGLYFRVAVGFHRHPKVMAAGRDGKDLVLAAWDYSKEHQTDGFVSSRTLRLVCAPMGGLDPEAYEPALLAALRAGLLEPRHDWEDESRMGYVIHDWPDWQELRAESDAARERRTDAATRAARARWNGHANGNAPRMPDALPDACEADAEGHAPTHAKTMLDKDEDKETLNSPNGESSGSHLTPLVREVYDHWRTERDHPNAKLLPKRVSVTKARFREGFTVAQLKKVVDAVKYDDWPERPKHDDMTVLFRDGTTVERWLEMGKRAQEQTPTGSAWAPTAPVPADWSLT